MIYVLMKHHMCCGENTWKNYHFCQSSKGKAIEHWQCIIGSGFEIFRVITTDSESVPIELARIPRGVSKFALDFSISRILDWRDLDIFKLKLCTFLRVKKWFKNSPLIFFTSMRRQQLSHLFLGRLPLANSSPGSKKSESPCLEYFYEDQK